MFARLLCWLGIHWPLNTTHWAFTDVVSGKDVFHAHCACGKQWLTDGIPGYFGFRVKSRREKGQDNGK